MDVMTGINVEWLYDGIGSADNQFLQNVIHQALIGIFVDYGSDRNLLSRNRFHYGGRPSIILQGASQNRVVGTSPAARRARSCASRRPIPGPACRCAARRT